MPPVAESFSKKILHPTAESVLEYDLSNSIDVERECPPSGNAVSPPIVNIFF